MSWALAGCFVCCVSGRHRDLGGRDAPRGDDERAGLCGCSPGLWLLMFSIMGSQPRTPLVPKLREDGNKSTYF